MLELVIVLAVIMIIAAISIPSFMNAVRAYQLTDAATQVASVLKFTRYEAIRVNTAATINSLVRPGGTGGCPAVATRCMWTDSNGDTAMQATENQILFSGSVDLVGPGTPPNTAGLAAAVGVAALTNVSITNGSMAFDQRGAVVPAAVNVLYIGNLRLPNLGDRAVVLLPSGSVQIWSTDAGGTWHQLN
jgi:Tfp pilus assembly protein FimT